MDTLEQVSLHKTHEFDYVIIRDSGWRVRMTWIDPEDLFIRSLDRKLLNREVKSISREKFQDGLKRLSVLIYN